MEPLLEQERHRCKKIENDLKRSKQELDTFRSVWEPAYGHWLHSRFGARLTKMRELESQVGELEYIMILVQEEVERSGCSEKTAYRRIKQIRKDAQFIEEIRSREESQDPDSDSELAAKLEEFLQKSFEQLFGAHPFSSEESKAHYQDFKQSFREEVLDEQRSSQKKEWDREEYEDPRESSQSRSGIKKEPISRTTDEDTRRKQLYRNLARKLHPDQNRNITPQEKVLWHEVQAAYDSKNLDLLESLAAIVESGDSGGYFRVQSVSGLREIFKRHEKNLRSVQKLIRQAKKQPSWNFTQTQNNPVQLRKLSQEIDRELKEVTAELKANLWHYENQIERWKSNSKRRRRGSKTARRESA